LEQESIYCEVSHAGNGTYKIDYRGGSWAAVDIVNRECGCNQYKLVEYHVYMQ